MPISVDINGEIGRISLAGKFDFAVQDDFRRVISEALDNNTIKDIQVDLAEVTFMDSSAIRLLLQLNMNASVIGKSVTLINCRDTIREIFAIGGFDSVLTIR